MGFLTFTEELLLCMCVCVLPRKERGEAGSDEALMLFVQSVTI